MYIHFIDHIFLMVNSFGTLHNADVPPGVEQPDEKRHSRDVSRLSNVEFHCCIFMLKHR